MADRDLARYQAALMDLFYRDDIDPAERQRRLATDPAFAPFASYVATFDPDLVALGSGILQRWGRPRRRRAARRTRARKR